ncbi:MAG: ROK family protein [Actinomycetes bacterium]
MRTTRRSGIGQERLRRHNLSQLLSHVHVSGPTSRSELTAALGVNRSTIGDLTGQLAEYGLVDEEQPGSARRSGRPSLLVVPRSDVAVVAVDLSVDRIDAALVALGGRVLERRRRRHQRGEHDVEHVTETVAQLTEEILGQHPAVHCVGIGVSLAGAVRLGDGLVRFAPNLGWVDAPFAGLLSKRLGRPVTAGNDANLGVLAEHLRGAAVGYQDVAYLSGSVGIGGGFLVGGVPLTGSEGFAGEIGHILVDRQGPPCRCGNAGCWEVMAGENALLTGAGRLPGGGPDAVAEVIAAAAEGDARAQQSLHEVAEWTGVGLRTVVNLFNPEIVVVGASLAQVFAAAEEQVLEAMRQTIPPMSELLVRAAGLGQDSSLIGAAERAFSPLLSAPFPVRGRAAR